jgi:hypothetical protein
MPTQPDSGETRAVLPAINGLPLQSDDVSHRLSFLPAYPLVAREIRVRAKPVSFRDASCAFSQATVKRRPETAVVNEDAPLCSELLRSVHARTPGDELSLKCQRTSMRTLTDRDAEGEPTFTTLRPLTVRGVET